MVNQIAGAVHPGAFHSRRHSGPPSHGTSTTTEQVYEVGTLVVDLFDTNTKRLLWRGSASDTLSAKSGKNIKNLDRDVAKMFERFPPQTRKG